MAIKITIDGVRYTPGWETLQTVMRDATNCDDIRFVRIDRKDNGCGYRGPGEYEIDYIDQYGDISRLELVVK
jgi:hypothetical protein